MKKLIIHKNGEAPLSIDFPEIASEWPVRLYIQFIAAVGQFNDWLKKIEVGEIDTFDFQAESFLWKTRCICAFLGLDQKEFFDIPLTVRSEELDDDALLSIDKMFNNIMTFANSVQPQEIVTNEDDSKYTFKYGDKTFEIDPLIATGIRDTDNSDLKLGHLVEIMDRKRKLYQTASDVKEEDENAIDPTGSKRYTMYLTTIAVLSDEVGAIKPDTPESFERYVRDRILFFKDIDIQTAIDVDFFLSVTMTDFESIQHINTFLKYHKTLKYQMSNKLDTTVNKRKRPKRHGIGQDTGRSSKEQLKQTHGR